MIQIEREKYFSHSMELKPEEVALIESFASWLPDDVIDCHAHCNLPEHVGNMEEKTLKHMLSTFPSYTLEESLQVQRLFFPDKSVRSLRFAKTFRGIDHRRANDYLLDNSPEADRIALFGLPEDVGYTTSMLSHPRVSALKMYYSYVEPTATLIYQYFKPEILEVAQDLNIPIILHPPKTITKCTEDLRTLLRDFPRLRVSIAHLGLSKILIPGLEDAFLEFAKYDNVSLDTALNPSAEVVALALRIFGEDRVMFGSDEPLHLVRSVVFVHPQKGERLMTEYPYHWVDADEQREFGHLAKGAVHAHWLSMGALRKAISALPSASQDQVKRKVFYKNAKQFFGF